MDHDFYCDISVLIVLTIVIIFHGSVYLISLFKENDGLSVKVPRLAMYRTCRRDKMDL